MEEQYGLSVVKLLKKCRNETCSAQHISFVNIWDTIVLRVD